MKTITIILAVLVMFLSTTAIQAATPATDCTLVLPRNPLSATGLATPFELTNTNPGEVCHQLDPDQSAFVQAAILDPYTGQISIYAPLVIDKGTQPAVAPIVPVLPPNAVVALWFGFNANNLKLQGHDSPPSPAGGKHSDPYVSYDSLHHGSRHHFRRFGFHLDNSPHPAFADLQLLESRCVNGVGRSLFGQYSYCNAFAFFEAAEAAIRRGKLTVPPLGTGLDGQLCPSVRSFTTVDQDQSDNVPTNYLAFNGQVAQFNLANVAALPGATKFGNPSDNRLVDLLLDPALGCVPFTAPDLSNPGVYAPALPLNELQARAFQTTPLALVPLNDPMTLVNGDYNLEKVNAYRRGVGQREAYRHGEADPKAYCDNLRAIHPARLALDQAFLVAKPSPFPLVASNLFTFMAQRYVASYSLLGCDQLLNQPVNVELTIDGTGIVTNAMVMN